MDIEQLKLVLETVSNVSGDAQAVAIWWLILDKLLPVVAWLIAGYGVYSLILMMVRTTNNEKDLVEIRNSLGINGASSWVRDGEIKQIKDKIKILQSK